MNPAVTLSPPRPRASFPPSVVLAGLGMAAFVAGLFLSSTRTWSAWLVSVFGLASLGLSGAIITALHHVTGARWSERILRVAHAMTAVLPVAGVAWLGLVFGAGELYPWAKPSEVAADHVLTDRSGWMNVTFVLARGLAAIGLWIWLSARLVRRSRRAIESGAEADARAATRASALLLVLASVTYSLVCFDALLSIERRWASTLLGLYHLSGLLLGGVAAFAWLVVRERRAGRLAVSDEVLQDLGKLLFAFAFFWGYLWYCQWMLVWYANLPEETGPYAVRHAGGWQPVAVLNVVLNWALPFVLLLPRRLKRREVALARIAVIVLVGRWLDISLAVAPTVGPTLAPAVTGPSLSVFEVLLPLGGAGAFLWTWARAYASPRLEVVPDRTPASR
jgi:hypothetical protein